MQEGGGGAKAQGLKINLNVADAPTLQRELAGTSQAKADAIVAYRETNGPFRSVDELLEVKASARRYWIAVAKSWIRHWRIHRSATDDLRDFSRSYNAVIRGWIEYYVNSGTETSAINC